MALLHGMHALGLEDVVVAPGSRSQALALAAAALDRAGLMTLHVRVDERVAGFTALGLAVESDRPVAVICTSGTAVANLHPAVLEAHHSGVPLVLLTADRPLELRGIGANQTTNQVGIFGDMVAADWDVAAPTGAPGELDDMRELAAIALSLRERVDLACVVDQALLLLDARIREERVSCVLDLTRPAWVRGDAIRLEQVLINLLRNALDAMRDKPLRRLEIRIDDTGEHWRLTVGDSGGGIADEHLANVFDPFFTTKPVGDGLGLGLAVSYAIVHESGGRLSAENLNNGARFFFSLSKAPETEPPC